jgi:hypothetical protein
MDWSEPAVTNAPIEDDMKKLGFAQGVMAH